MVAVTSKNFSKTVKTVYILGVRTGLLKSIIFIKKFALLQNFQRPLTNLIAFANSTQHSAADFITKCYEAAAASS